MKKFFSTVLILFILLSGSNTFAATDGLKTIYIFVKDKAGNIQITAQTGTITLDTTSPSIVFSANPDDTQSQTKTVRATITDTNLDTIQYVQIPSATACNGLLTYTTSYTSGSGIILSSESDNGTKICFKAKDLANNYAYLSSNTIDNLDRTAPTISVAHKNGADQVIGSTDPTTTRKISATINDVTTGSSNFGSPTLYVSPTLSAGTYTNSSECVGTTYTAYSAQRVFSDPVVDNGKQMCFRGVDPAGNTSYELVTIVMNAIPTFTSVSKNDTHINSTNSGAVSFTVNGILDNDNDDVTIKYSWDGTNYTDLDTVSNTNISSSHGPFTLNTTILPEGNNTLYVKLNDGNYDSSVKNITIFKDSILPVLSIHNISNSNPAQIKYLSGSISDTNSFSGYIKIVDSSEICSNETYTTSYTSGQNITLDNESYNGKKVCFKAVDEYGNTKYSESATISGIDRTAPVTPTSVIINSGDLFTNDKILNLDITHPNDSDIYEWCVTESNDYNSCVWSLSKPTTYELQD